MKPSLLLILLFVSFSFSANSQIGYGPELGIGASTLKFAPPLTPIAYTAASVSSIASGKIGGIIDIPFQKHIYFQAGLSFSAKGASRSFSYYRNDSFNEAINQTLTLYYFDLPLSICYKSGMQGKGRFIAGLGATPSYIIAGKNKLHDYQVYNDTLSNTDNTYQVVAGQTLKGFDIGVTLTAGYELSTGLFFRAYYTAGVNDVGMGTEIDKNRMFGIAAGYIFGKGRNINKEATDLIDKTTD